MPNTFREKIIGYTAVNEYLPIFHTTDGFGFRDILHSMELKTTQCKVFSNEQLFYTFYGKPAYRKKDEYNYYDISRFPVVLMLRLPVNAEIFNIFPFDSGAFCNFEKEIKDKFFHKKNKLEDFELGIDLESVKKLINFFYGSNNSYLREKPKSEITEIKALDFELNSYHKLINDKTANLFDDRAKVVEISFKTDLQLTKKNLVNVFLPNEFLIDNEFKNLISNRIPLNRLIPYFTSSGSLDSYHHSILEKVINKLKKH